jgi:alkanesulfonate monooxygenase SsuD/methylene tetrahydromethanopterin reductase-like flavin-dependent oxidoreductase (luciferase family)
MPLETRWESIHHLATRADALGYDTFTLPETWAYDTTVLLATLAAQTKQIRLSTGILGVWNRSAATIAMAAASLQTVSGGRFMLGLGASTPQLVEGLHDLSYEAPYEQIRRVVTQVRALLAGERVTLSDGKDARPLRLNVDPQPETPILLAASSPRSIRLAGELCDGWIPFLYPRDHLPEAIDILKEGRQSSEFSERPLQILPSLPTVIHKDASKAREGAAWFVAFYITTMGDMYRESVRRMGFSAEVDAVMAANEGQRPAIVPPEAEVLLEQLTVYGTPEDARQQLDKWFDAGATLPGLLLLPNMSDAEIDFTLEGLHTN